MNAKYGRSATTARSGQAASGGQQSEDWLDTVNQTVDEADDQDWEWESGSIDPGAASVSAQEVDPLTEYQVYKQFGYEDKAAASLAGYLDKIERAPEKLVHELANLSLSTGNIDLLASALEKHAGVLNVDDLASYVREGLSVDPHNLPLRVVAESQLSWGMKEVAQQIGEQTGLGGDDADGAGSSSHRASAAADGTPADGTPFQVFSRGVASFFVGFGLDQHFASVFMTMCVSALALTSLDAVARIGRMSFQELFSVDDMEHAEGWRKLLCNVYFSTFITLVFGFILTKIGYANIWPLFGSANQLLSALVLATLCVFLKVTGRSNKMIFPPLIIMLCVTFTALVQRLIAMVKAISNAAAVTIPAGETTWGAVFIANGLQLILAVLLIVLGLNIVFHSFSAYKKAEHNSEAKA